MARTWHSLGVAVLLTGLVGCGGSTPKPSAEIAESPSPSETTVTETAVAAATPTAPTQPQSLNPRLHLPYEQAVLTDIPEGHDLPPDQTMTGVSTGKLHDQVHAAWDHIMFELPTGKAVQYTASLETEEGTIEIALRPDVAPNHVRNFVALARVGYFDGLVFEKVIHQTPEPDTEGTPVDLIEFGCPLGLGDYLRGHLGYFLKPEFDEQMLHLEGTVGAWHGENPATACSRFYITLGPTPVLNGQYTAFGRVTKGLDVARKIHKQPVVTGSDGQQDRPAKPVVVRKVSITTQEVDKPLN